MLIRILFAFMILSGILLASCENNEQPRILDFYYLEDSVFTSDTIEIYYEVNDPNEDSLEILFESNCGRILNYNNSQLTWIAPSEVVSCMIYLKVSDGELKSTRQIQIEVFRRKFLMTDNRDGRLYSYVKIGEDYWMTKNLNFGIMIDSNSDQRDNDLVEKYCYNDDNEFCEQYGGLYSWNEALNYQGSESDTDVCPDGWHVATEKDWQNLERALGVPEDQILDQGWRIYTNIGFILKSINGWDDDKNGNNSTGFNGLPSGYFIRDVGFRGLGYTLRMWSSTYNRTYNYADFAWSRNLGGQMEIYRTDQRVVNYQSIRCVKNN